MTNLRLMSVVKKKSPRRDSADEWIVMTDPITEYQEPLRISKSALNDEDFEFDPFYCLSMEELIERERSGTRLKHIHFSSSRFFDFNNELVKAAVISGYEPGKKYDKLLEVGLRASQQLSWPLRFRTVQEYERLKDELREELLEYSVNTSRQRRNQRLDQIVEWSDSVPQEDREYISFAVEYLKQKVIEVREKEGNRPLRLDKIVKEIMDDDNDYLLVFFPKVADSLKARFLSVVKYAQLNDREINWNEGSGFYQEIFTVMQGIGEENSKIYLGILLNALEKDDFDDIRVWTYDAGRSYIENLSQEQKKLSRYKKRPISTARIKSREVLWQESKPLSQLG